MEVLLRQRRCLTRRSLVRNPCRLSARHAMDWRERIAVELVIDLLARGYTAQQIVGQYDHVAIDDVHACLACAAEVGSV